MRCWILTPFSNDCALFYTKQEPNIIYNYNKNTYLSKLVSVETIPDFASIPNIVCDRESSKDTRTYDRMPPSGSRADTVQTEAPAGCSSGIDAT